MSSFPNKYNRNKYRVLKVVVSSYFNCLFLRILYGSFKTSRKVFADFFDI